jgi:hypothetical protein
MIVKCSYCGNEVKKLPKVVRQYKKFFCNLEEYHKYRKENRYYPKQRNMEMLRKIKTFSKIRSC